MHRHEVATGESRGARAHRAAHTDTPFTGYDGKPLNWCYPCQVHLLWCRSIGCPRAHDEVLIYAYIAAEYALSRARKGNQRWDGEQEDVASTAAHAKTHARLAQLKPDTWDPGWSHTSLINWLGRYADRAAREAIGEINKRRRRHTRGSLDATDRYGRTPEISDPSWSGNVENTYQEREDLDQFRTSDSPRLQNAWNELVDRMLTAVDGIPLQGRHTNRPQTFLLWYLDRFTTWSHHHNTLYGPGPSSDRQLALYLGLGNATITRIRKNNLLPALNDLYEDPHLDADQHQALTAFIGYLNYDTPSIELTASEKAHFRALAAEEETS